MNESTADHPRFPARFNELPWYRSNVPCMEACPVHTDSGRYVQLIADGRFEDAFLIARSPNPLASVCGRVCSAPCEDACRRGWIDEAVTIRPLKRFVTEQFGAESAQPDFFKLMMSESQADTRGSAENPSPSENREEVRDGVSGRALMDQASDSGCRRLWHMDQLSGEDTVAGDRGHRVAVIGSGPAGLGCAHDLALMGYDVTVFEALPELGGMLRYGIPEYRLPRGVIDREIAAIEKLGVTFLTNKPITREFGLPHLREEGFEAFFLSVGAMRGRDLNIEGSDKDGVVKAVDYLLNLNRGYRVDLGKRVVVIGGGSVALDAARTAVREFYQPMDEIELTAKAVASQPAMDAARGALRGGASEVHVISLESLDELPAAQTVQGREELDEALEEGIHLHPGWGPKKIVGNGDVEGIEFVGVERVFDEEGHFNPLFDDSRTMALDADSVILAIGQQPDFSFLTNEDGVELSPTGAVKIDPGTLATTARGVFAGGDAAFGPRIAIEAVANGKHAARSIHEHLAGTQASISMQVDIQKIPTDEYAMPEAYEKKARRSAPTVSAGRRTGITEVEKVMSAEQARNQAERCLSCHVDTIYDPHRCVLCNRCADVCPEKCLTFVPLGQVDMPAEQLEAALETYGHDRDQPMTVLLKDDTICIRCGLCAARCPTEAMTMERFNFIESTE